MADGQVVEEEQWRGPGAHQVVDAHGHQVPPDGVQAAGQSGNLGLGPHPVGGRYQQGIPEPGRRRVKEAAKTADVTHHPGPTGGPDQWPDPPNGLSAGV